MEVKNTRDTIIFIVILLLAVNILIKYKEAQRTKEKLSVLMGGPFCFMAIILLLLDFILI